MAYAITKTHEITYTATYAKAVDEAMRTLNLKAGNYNDTVNGIAYVNESEDYVNLLQAMKLRNIPITIGSTGPL